MSAQAEPASFRDPSGFVFRRGDDLLRQVQERYRSDYDRATSSGLYAALTEAGLLVPHVEESLELAMAPGAYRVLRPERVPFVSYPYEWCFSALRDAALLTLSVQKEALRFGMSLKDASAYNVQFRAGRPVFIDTLSFETCEDGRPWAAYRQFCQHFVAPLALMSATDIRLGQLLRTNVDGVPLDLAGRLLPRRSCLSPGLLAHVHLHGRAQKRSSEAPARGRPAGAGMSRRALLGLIDSLESTVRGQRWNPAGTTWADYYARTNYSDDAMAGKRRLVGAMLDAITPRPGMVWDLGANTGLFSRLASERGAQTIAWDVDPAAVERNYLDCRAAGETLVLPLLQDLTNPSPDLGWALEERQSLRSRGPADAALALALVHHLAIANNVPLGRVAQFMRSAGRWLIVEFVPRSDSQVQRLLATRDDVFPDYTQAGFEEAFGRCFRILRRAAVPDSERTLYLMRADPPSGAD